MISATMLESLPLSAGDKVLILTTSDTHPESMKSIVEVLSQQISQSGKINVEHVDRLLMGEC